MKLGKLSLVSNEIKTFLDAFVSGYRAAQLPSFIKIFPVHTERIASSVADGTTVKVTYCVPVEMLIAVDDINCYSINR